MYVLDIQQVQTIESLVKKEDLSFSHLPDDLVDHICCDVELLMEDGINFTDALNKVKKEIGTGGLKKIQESTLFLINKNYRIMKKTMRIFGLVAPTLLAIGSLLKVYHLPGAGVLITLGAVLLSCVFLPAAVYTMYQETQSKKRIFVYFTGFFGGFTYVLGVLFKLMHWSGAPIFLTLSLLVIPLIFLPALLISKLQDETNKRLIPAYVISFVSLMIWILGMLFKIQHWPGAKIMLSLGMFIIIFIALPVYYFMSLKVESYVKGSYIFLIIALTEVVITGGLMQLNLSHSYLTSFQDTEDKIYQTIAFLETKNNMYYAQFNDEEAKKLKKIKEASHRTVEQIQQHKIELINRLEGDNASNVWVDDKLNLMNLMRKLSPDKVFQVMIDETKDGLGYTLYNELMDYYSVIEPIKTVNTDLTELLFCSETIPDKEKWVNEQFINMPAVAILNQLSIWQRNVRYIESVIVNSMKKESI